MLHVPGGGGWGHYEDSIFIFTSCHMFQGVGGGVMKTLHLCVTCSRGWGRWGHYEDSIFIFTSCHMFQGVGVL